MSRKLWPVEQLLEWLQNTESKYVRISTNDLLVLIAILKFADNVTLECFPSIEKISRITLKAKTRVRDVLKRLINLGILEKKMRKKENGDQDSNLYIYKPENLWGVGSLCSLPWATSVAYPRLRVLPLTTNITTHITNKQVAPHLSDQKKIKSACVQPSNEKHQLANTAKRASALLEEFMNKRS